MNAFFKILNIIFFLPSILVMMFIIMLEVIPYRNKNKDADLNELFGFCISRVDVHTSEKYFGIFRWVVSILLWMALFNFIYR